MVTHDTSWADQKQRLQLRWPALTDADLDSTGGDREALLGLLQGRLGYAAGNAEGDLDEILAGEVVVPRDIADEDTHTGTSGPVSNPSPSTNSPSWPERTHSGVWDETPVREGVESSERGYATYGESPSSYRALGDSASDARPTNHLAWQVPALAAAGLGTVAAASFAFLRRRSRRKRLRIEVPVPTVPLQAERARKLAYQAVDSKRASTAAVLETAAARIGPRTDRTAAGLQDAAVKAADGMQDAAGYLRQHETGEIWGDVERYLKQHPVRMALVAVAAVIAMSRFLR